MLTLLYLPANQSPCFCPPTPEFTSHTQLWRSFYVSIMKLSSLNSSTPSRVLTVNPSFFPEKLPWPDLGTAVWLQPQPSSLLPLSTNRANIALLACFDCFSNLKLDVLRWPLYFLSPRPPVSAQICSGLSLSLPLVLCPNAT